MARVFCALALGGIFAATAFAAAARTVTVTAQDYPLVCGQATGLVQVVFPASVRLPAAIEPSAVAVNRRAASSVSVHGRTVRVRVARKPGVTCLSVVLGKLTITFAPRARVDVGTARSAARAARDDELPRARLRLAVTDPPL